VLCIYNTLANHQWPPSLHPEPEQAAIEAGYYWWNNSQKQAIMEGATLDIHLKDHDQGAGLLEP
jgi:hypothetical protein